MSQEPKYSKSAKRKHSPSLLIPSTSYLCANSAARWARSNTPNDSVHDQLSQARHKAARTVAQLAFPYIVGAGSFLEQKYDSHVGLVRVSRSIDQSTAAEFLGPAAANEAPIHSPRTSSRSFQSQNAKLGMLPDWERGRLSRALRTCPEFSRFADNTREAATLLDTAKFLTSVRITNTDAICGKTISLPIRQACEGNDCVVSVHAETDGNWLEPSNSDGATTTPPLLLVVDRILEIPLPPNSDHSEEITFVVGQLLSLANPLVGGWVSDDDPEDCTPGAVSRRQHLLQQCLPGPLAQKCQMWLPCRAVERYMAVTLECINTLDPCFPIVSTASAVKTNNKDSLASMSRQLLLDTPRLRLPFLSPSSWIKSNECLRGETIAEGSRRTLSSLYDTYLAPSLGTESESESDQE